MCSTTWLQMTTSNMVTKYNLIKLPYTKAIIHWLGRPEALCFYGFQIAVKNIHDLGLPEEHPPP